MNPVPESECLNPKNTGDFVKSRGRIRKAVGTHRARCTSWSSSHAEMRRVKRRPGASNYPQHRLPSISALMFTLPCLSSPLCCTIDNTLCKFYSGANAHICICNNQSAPVYEGIPHSNLKENRAKLFLYDVIRQ